MKIDFGGSDIHTSNSRRDGSVIDWVRGLREQNVTRIGFYNQTRSAPLALVVTLVDRSLYLIRRLANESTNDGYPKNTIESTTSSYFTSRPVIDVTFYPQSYPDLRLIIYTCCSISQFDEHDHVVDGRSFGLAVLLNTVRHVLTSTDSSSTETSTLSESPEYSKKTPLSAFWKDAYRLAQKDDHSFWEGSLPERTDDLVRDVIYKTAHDALTQVPHIRGSVDSASIYSTIAQAEILALKGITQFSPTSMAWDKSSVESTPTKLRMFCVPLLTNNSTRRLSAQIDARDLPHQYYFREILHNTGLELIDNQFIGEKGSETTLGPPCSSKSDQSRIEGAINAIDGSQSPVRGNDHQIWMSDWQIAAHLAWNYAWPHAFQAGQNLARNSYERHRRKLHPAVRIVVDLHRWATKKVAQKEAKQLQMTKQYEDDRRAAVQKRSNYSSKASERAMQAMHRQGLEYIAQQEWQRFSTGAVIGYIFPDRGWVAQKWKKVFQDTCKAAWTSSWEITWLAVWEDAYRLASSKGKEFGMRSESAKLRSLPDGLEDSASYREIKDYIKQGEFDDIMNNVRLLAQDLSHISGLIAIHNIYMYDNHVTIRALVPNKNQDLEDMSRILPKQPVSRELSYMELKHFIIGQYFKEPGRTRGSFKQVVSKSWRDLPTLLENADSV